MEDFFETLAAHPFVDMYMVLLVIIISAVIIEIVELITKKIK